MSEEFSYAIKLTDDGYALFYQEYENDDIYVQSVREISRADYWNEEDARATFEQMLAGEIEDIPVMFTTEAKPLKVVRVSFKVEEDWI